METYDLNDVEQRHFQSIQDGIAANGGKLYQTDRFGDLVRGPGGPIAIEYEVLRGGQFCVDNHGTLWRYAGLGASKMPGISGGGAKRRNPAVEMWTGHWRKVKGPDGKGTYAKCTIWCSVDLCVNNFPGVSHIDWYTNTKGFGHPLSEPHAPTASQIRVMEGEQENIDQAVYAKIDDLAERMGMDAKQIKAASETDAQPAGDNAIVAKPPKKRRSNRKPNAAR
ncbi:MAG: hypothetical protein KAV00_06785 [Phycisphaerae bacterium]|nr:hypothetical protein [Phycisphaerae bacterium]